MNTFKLSINKKAFEVMVTGEKFEEFRNESKWILSRLNKDHDYIQFTNGYESESPVFIAKYSGYTTANIDEVYSNGLAVKGENIVI